MKKILVITSSIDYTVDYIVDKYQTKVEFYRFDVDKFAEYEIIIGQAEGWIMRCKRWCIRESEIHSIYYRKPRLPHLDEFESDYRGMIAKDIIALVNGMVDSFKGKVLTKPYILRAAENKVYQLLYAKKEGLKIPESFIGNSTGVASCFTERHSIIKPITTGKIISKNHVEIFQTSCFTELNEDISLMPVYLQEYVSKKYEVRLTCINNNLFPIRIDSNDKLDWRKDYAGLKYEIIDCPEHVKKICLKLLDDFGLQYGAFDFIVTDNDEWVFLEVNPNGQWLWLEKLLNLTIAEKIVDYLMT